jgi:hypothetical protein
VIAEIVVELEDFRTGDNQSAQRPGDEQALVPGAIVDRRQVMEEESPAVLIVGPKLFIEPGTKAFSSFRA